jgi:hypothetical protein
MLKQGNYMLASKVNNFLFNYYESIFNSLLDNPIPTYQGELGSYYITSDIKGIVDEDTFKEMECECVTYVINK